MSKSKSIASMTFQVMAITLTIKILGLLKQVIIAAVCGATSETDAYFIASGIILALSAVFFSAVSISFLSMYSERLIKEGRGSANNLISVVLKVFVPISIIISIVFFVAAPVFAKVFAPSYTGDQLTTLTSYIRIMSVMFVFSCYTLIINVPLEADKRFLPGRFQNLIQNCFVIIAALILYKPYGIKALLFAFIAAGIVQCIQISVSARKIFSFRIKTTSENKSVKHLVTLILPLLLGNAMYEINDIVDKQIASGIGSGSVSFLTYGASVNEIISTLIISSVSTVLFSHFASWAAKSEIKNIESSIKKALEYILLMIIPIIILCIICGDNIVGVLYGRGKFDQMAIDNTTAVVIGYALGFFFQAARAIIIRVYYAFQDTKTPMINGLIAVGSNIAMSILLSKFLGVSGIALATSIAMLIVTILLIPKIKRYLPEFTLRQSYSEYIKMIVAGAVTGGLSYLLRSIIDLPDLFSLLLIGIFTVAVYCILTQVLKVQSTAAVLLIAKSKVNSFLNRK